MSSSVSFVPHPSNTFSLLSTSLFFSFYQCSFRPTRFLGTTEYLNYSHQQPIDRCIMLVFMFWLLNCQKRLENDRTFPKMTKFNQKRERMEAKKEAPLL
mmetsp:Transcript_53492/g.62493  ORF Transcript_53492/g.62493 Transcript_53492/m.62493 type:complete len:99 (+) Transcript_53492:157-453(+)